MRPSDVDLERLATDLTTIPLPETPAPSESSSFLSRLFGHFLHGEDEAEPKLRSKQIAKAPERANAFGVTSPKPAAQPSVTDGKTPKIPDLMAATRAWLLESPRPLRDVPYRPKEDQVGHVLPGGELDFTNVPKTPGAEEAGNGPSSTFIQALRGRWWTRGKHNEPRILARDVQGNICARYRLDGTCVSGDHYPPAIFNRHATADTPVYLVAGPYEMAWLVERKILASQKMDESGRMVADPTGVPHVIWDAKGADYAPVAKDLATTKDVVIVRAKDDPQQEIWARQLQDMLLQQWRVKTKVLPPLPPLNPDQEAQVHLPPVARPRLRRG